MRGLIAIFSEYLINIFHWGRKNILAKCRFPYKVEKGKGEEGSLYFSLKTQTFSYNLSHRYTCEPDKFRGLKINQ